MRSVSILFAAFALSTTCFLPVGGCRRLSGEPRGEASSPESGPEGRTITALGRLRPFDGIVSVSAIPGERLAMLAVSENGDIRAGESLGRLASYQLRETELAGLLAQRDAADEKKKTELPVAEARVQQAEVALAQARMKQAEIALNTSDVELLREQVAMARSDLQRLKQLSTDDPELVTKAEMERKELEFRKLEVEWTQATKTLELATKTSQLAVAAAAADLQAAEALLNQFKTSNETAVLDERIKAAMVQKSWAELPAPCTGTVLKIYLAPGEFVSQTPILQIADLTKMGCVAEVYEADVKSIHEGGEVVLESSAFREKFAQSGIRGTVARIGKLIGQPGMRSLNPMERTDRHVVEVLIRIDPEDADATAEAARLVDLQVTVKFRQPERASD